MPDVNIRTDARYVELDTGRTIRYRNKVYYRVCHWPIWIFVFFIAPGPLTFDLFERGFDRRTLTWLSMVLCGTGVAALRGRLPGCEPTPYIIRFTEDRPNPLADPSRRRRSHDRARDGGAAPDSRAQPAHRICDGRRVPAAIP